MIGIGVTWAFFFAAWGKGGLSTDSVAFNSLLAGAIASTLVIVLTFFISLSVVGAIVLAIFGIFDLFALIACKAGAKAACDIGIHGSHHQGAHRLALHWRGDDQHIGPRPFPPFRR